MRITIVIILAIALSSCSSRYYSKRGDFFYDDLSYSKSVALYEKSLQKKYNRNVSLKLADSYYHKGDYLNAMKVVKQMETKDSISAVKDVLIARIYMANKEYDKARLYLSENFSKQDKLASGYKQAIELIDNVHHDSVSIITPVNLGNSTDVFSPNIVNDKMYFSELGSQDKKHDEWTGSSFSRILSGKISNDTIIENITDVNFMGENNKYHIGVISLFDNGNSALISASQELTKGLVFKEDMDETINLGIYEVIKGEDGWDSINKLFFVEPQFSYMHPHYNEATSTLFFASDMLGGEGGFDIYYSKREGKGWSSPVNAGTTINTLANELFPFACNDNSLYFSSEGHTNIGGLDIFKSQKKGSQYSEPVNIGIPINSSYDDFGVFADSCQVKYFSSNREGYNKIYHSSPKELEILLAYVELTVEDQQKKEIPEAQITFSLDSTLTTDSIGYVKTPALEKGKQYVFAIKKEGYYDQEYAVTIPSKITKDNSIIRKTITMIEIVDTTVVKIVEDPVISEQTKEMLDLEMENIYFDFDKSNIRKDAYITLVKIADFLKENPTVTIELFSHCDSRGSDEYNMSLSKRRSISVVETLIELGVNKDNIRAYYMGEQMLTNDCDENANCTEALHQLNRRAVFTLNNKLINMLDSKYNLGKVKLQDVYVGKNTLDKSSRLAQTKDSLKTVSGTNQWYVIAASFTDLNSALSFQMKLESKGFDKKDIYVLKSADDANYRVSVAKAPTNKLINRTLRQMQSDNPDMKFWIFED